MSDADSNQTGTGSNAGWIAAIFIALIGSPVLVEVVKSFDQESDLVVKTLPLKQAQSIIPPEISKVHTDLSTQLRQYFDLSKPVAEKKIHNIIFFHKENDVVELSLVVTTMLKNYSTEKPQYFKLLMQGDNKAKLDKFRYRKQGENWVSLRTKRKLEEESTFIEVILKQGIKIDPGETLEVEKNVFVTKELEGEFSISVSETVLSGVDYKYEISNTSAPLKVTPYIVAQKFSTGDQVSACNLNAELSHSGLLLKGQGIVFQFERDNFNKCKPETSSSLHTEGDPHA